MRKPALASKPNARTWIARILLLGFSLLITLAGLEFLLRRVPGLVPLPAFFSLPGGGRYLQALDFDGPPIEMGFLYQPLQDCPFQSFPDDPSILGFQAADIAPRAVPRVLDMHLTTDEAGFLNPPGQEAYDLVVSGDSFLGLSAKVHWLELAAEASGQRIRNLGMPGWGPQAEAAALRRYGKVGRPRERMLVWFEGNDLWDAMVYEEHRASGLRWDAYDLAGSRWQDRLLLPAFARWRWAQFRSQPDPSRWRYPLRADIGGQSQDLVFADLYVQRLGLTEADIEASRNWELASEAIIQALLDADEAGQDFRLIYVPSEPRVYLPELKDSPDLRRAIEAVPAVALAADGWIRPVEGPTQLADVRDRMDAQAGLMRAFAEEYGIPFLDLTPAFRAAASDGATLYNYADTHWNDAGHRLAAEALIEVLGKARE
jgi:hypothetical protein